MSAGLHVFTEVRRGTFRLDVDLKLDVGRVLAVLGPNGCGKSTLLGLIAGSLVPDVGSVTWRGRVLSAAGQQPVPMEQRRIGLLGQDPLLFPHLSAVDNVAFGLPGSARRARGDALGWLERLDVADLAQQKPRELSGGQAARVAIARALAPGPELLLLDEPLAALDAAAAPQLRQVLSEVLTESDLTAIIVSHDVLDAALLADDIAVIQEGSVVESGGQEVLRLPRTAFTAAFVGVNLVPLGYGGLRPAGDGDTAGSAAMRFRPSDVTVTLDNPASANSFAATVRWVEPATGGARLRLQLLDNDGPDVLADVDSISLERDLLRPGAQVWACVDPAAIAVV